MGHLAEKQKLIDIIQGKEQMYSRMHYVLGYEQFVKATSKEEAEAKFRHKHSDVIDTGEAVDCDTDSEVWELEEVPVEEYYGE